MVDNKRPSRFSADRARGALIGLAIGDALGTTLEFAKRDSLPVHTQMTGGGPFSLAAGTWTDDTSMALCLSDSLIAYGKVEPADLMQRFTRWWRDGENSATGECFDIGNATAAALEKFEQSGDPLSGDPSPSAAGNGSLMRLAPVAIFHCDDKKTAMHAARMQSQPTHASPECLDACEAFAGLLVEAILGADKDAILSRTNARSTGKVAAVLGGSWREKSREEIKSSGYVIDTLEAALWAVGQSNSFEDALILAVNLADDADTVGAVTGQLAGAIWGAKNIPERWMKNLAWRERLEATALALIRQGAAERGLPAFLNRSASRSKDNGWLKDVANGRWNAIPNGLTYDDSVPFANLIDGYGMADRLGLGHSSDVADRTFNEFYATGQWSASAVELWITLHFQHRADRLTLTLDMPEPQPHLDALCSAIREQLISGMIWPDG